MNSEAAIIILVALVGFLVGFLVTSVLLWLLG
jgi:hypothetical protein